MFLYIALCLLSFVMTWFYAWCQWRAGRLELPNARSSHVTPTPSGGGIVFAFLTVAYLSVLCLQNEVAWMTWLGLVLIAVIGYLDDLSPRSVKLRISIHLTSSLFVLLGMMPISSILPMLHGLPVMLVGVLSLTWLLNLYNFMDGVDGLASVETLSVVAVSGLFMCFFVPDSSILLLSVHWVVLGVVFGFLLCNFPKAKIFMGDVGSGFLGLLMGTLCLLSMKYDIAMFWVWVILLGVFIVDATVTLLRRFFARENVAQAHCTHAYQHAAQRYGSHKTVTLGVLSINLFWLAPWAYVTIHGDVHGLLATLIAYAPLVWLAFLFKAGMKGV